MRHYPSRIEITTFGDTKRTFLEPCYIETSPGGDPVDYRRVVEPYEPGVEWAINHPTQAEEYCQQRTTWWERLVAAMRAAW